MMEDKLYTAEEMAAILGVSKGTIWRYGRNGELPTLRVGRRVRFVLPKVKESKDDVCVQSLWSDIR